MAPKKKKGKKGGAVIDGVDTTPMTREKLEKFALRLRAETEREREERSYFQLERDKIRTYWEITHQSLDEAKTTLRNKDREIEETEEHNLVETKHFQQSVKHLMYEHHGDKCDMRAEQLMALKAAQDDHEHQENELLRDKKELKDRLREIDQQGVEQIRMLKLQYSQDISEARAKFESEAREIEAKYDKKLFDMREELDVKHRMEITEVEVRKNQQIEDLIKNHETAFRDLKIYYNDITINNLSLITTLKEQMEELKGYAERMERVVSDIMAENKKLVQPLKEAQDKMREMSHKMMNYEKDKIALANTKERLTIIQKQLSDLKWENSALELRFDKVKSDRAILRDRFLEAVLELQKRTGLKTSMLTKKVVELTNNTEHRETVMAEILAATNLEPTAINNRLETILTCKNNEIQDTQYELARVCKAHDDLLNTYECKLEQFGVPTAELGFAPLRTNIRNLGKGPAGLVTENK